jgi:hypothetical protein
MQKLFKADACYESLKKSGLLNQGEDDMRECIFLEMGGNAAAALKAIKKSLFASGPGSIPIEKKLECWAFVKFCYRHGLFDELQSHQEAIVPAFPFLTFCFIKARLERGEAPLELIEKYRPLNKNVGPFMCAEALVYLNPCLPHFNLSKARELLLESLKYTHQYGDAWIELARLAMIEHGPDVDLRELEQKFVGRPPNYGELWYFLGGSYPGAPLLQFRCAISKLREEMRPLMPIYNNAKAGRFGPSDQAFLFSAASISYCRTAASGTLASSITRYQQLDLAKAAWGKR